MAKVKLKSGADGHELTVAEQQKGGRKSGKVRRQKKLLKELIQEFGTLDLKNPKMLKVMEEMGIDSELMTNDMGTVVAQYLSAMKGNTQAFLALRDTKEEKPVDKVEQTVVAPKPLIDLTDRKKNGEDNSAQ